MAALMEGRPHDEVEPSESVTNILARYRNIEDWWSSDDLDADVLPFFADWLVEKLTLVESSPLTTTWPTRSSRR